MPVNTAWFKNRLADQKMSQRALARQLGLDPAAVSLTLRGKREMKIAEAVSIASLLGVPADEVMRHSGVNIASNGKKVLVCSFMDASAEVHHEDTGLTVPHPGGDLPIFLTAIQCRTAGTDLDHMDGWVMFANINMDGTVQADAVGRLSVARLRNGVMHIAKLARGSRRGVWNLVSPIGTIKDAELEWAKPILLVTP